jgi:endogenous inhibitor of DNA gyrase (YacG/DUF329 family)
MTAQKGKIVFCPQCGKEGIWDKENKFRPFCSERCKLIDLGNWANENYRVPIEENKDIPSNDESN